MATARTTLLPKWYWLIAGLALLWMAFGCFVYVDSMSMSAEELMQLPQSQQDVLSAMPVWATAAYAIAVWAGLAGAVALVLRRGWAVPLFIISLLGIVVQFGWLFLATQLLAIDGPSAAAFPLVVTIIGILLVWFAAHARRQGWIA